MAQKFHGHVHFANGLHRRILGQRRLHLMRQEQEWDLHDMGSVYRRRSERSNFWLSVFCSVARVTSDLSGYPCNLLKKLFSSPGFSGGCAVASRIRARIPPRILASTPRR